MIHFGFDVVGMYWGFFPNVTAFLQFAFILHSTYSLDETCNVVN